MLIHGGVRWTPRVIIVYDIAMTTQASLKQGGRDRDTREATDYGMLSLKESETPIPVTQGYLVIVWP